MKPVHKFILLGCMALSVGTFVFGVLQLAGPATAKPAVPSQAASGTNSSTGAK